MRIACWITRATNTQLEYVILIAFPLQQWLRYTYIVHARVICNMSYKKKLTLKGTDRRQANGNYQKTVAEKRGKWQSQANSYVGTVNIHYRHIEAQLEEKERDGLNKLRDRNWFQFVHDDDELQ